MPKQSKKVMVFGVFDGLHPGHRAFLRQAKRHGKRLIAIVARDSTVRNLKNKKPVWGERKRLAVVRKTKWVTIAVLGNHRQGTYGVVKKYRPDVICFGYDQKWLEKDLKMRMRQGLLPKIRLAKLKPYQARKFKSSKLNSYLFSNS